MSEEPRSRTYRETGRAPRLGFAALRQAFRLASTEWIRDNAPRLGASVAFYTLLSLAPVIVIAVAVAAAVYGRDAAQGRFASEIQGMAGPEVARRLQELIAGAYQPRVGLIATLLGLATLVFGASSVFVELHDAMNTIWDVPLPRDRNTAATLIRLIRDRFYSFAMVLGIGLLLLVSLVLSAWIATANIAVPPAATFVLSYLLIAVLFAALYKVVPDVRLTWPDVAPGAMIAAFLFLIGKQLMGFYFAHTGAGSVYSAAGSPIVVLLWLYYSAQLFFWGAEFSKVHKRTAGLHQ